MPGSAIYLPKAKPEGRLKQALESDPGKANLGDLSAEPSRPSAPFSPDQWIHSKGLDQAIHLLLPVHPLSYPANIGSIKFGNHGFFYPILPSLPALVLFPYIWRGWLPTVDLVIPAFEVVPVCYSMPVYTCFDI